MIELDKSVNEKSIEIEEIDRFIEDFSKKYDLRSMWAE